MAIFKEAGVTRLRLSGGRLAQLVEHLVYTERVGGSSPSPPTTTSAWRFGACASTVWIALSICAAFVLPSARAFAQGAPMQFHLARIEDRNCARDCPQVIVAEGVIEEDTPDAFVDFVQSTAASQPGARGVVLLSSPGGRVVASMQLGATFRKMGAAVIIARSLHEGERDVAVAGQCMSACVYAMMGGVKRVVPPESRVGIHRMSREEASPNLARSIHGSIRTYASEDMVDALADYAAQMGVNPTIIHTAERISPDEIHILSANEIRRWRLASPKL
jgi:hypothetical protein